MHSEKFQKVGLYFASLVTFMPYLQLISQKFPCKNPRSTTEQLVCGEMHAELPWSLFLNQNKHARIKCLLYIAVISMQLWTLFKDISTHMHTLIINIYTHNYLPNLYMGFLHLCEIRAIAFLGQKKFKFITLTNSPKLMDITKIAVADSLSDPHPSLSPPSMQYTWSTKAVNGVQAMQRNRISEEK